MAESMIGFGYLGTLCPSESTIPTLEGGNSCSPALEQNTGVEAITSGEGPETIGFVRFEDLDTKIADAIGRSTSIAGENNSNLTADTLLAYYFETVIGKDDPETTIIDESRVIKRLAANTPMTIPIVRVGTNETIGQAPAALVEYVYGSNEYSSIIPDFRAYQVVALLNDTGYTFSIEAAERLMPSGRVPTIMQTVTDSFKFVVGESDPEEQLGQ
jgi:hypothetical protein